MLKERYLILGDLLFGSKPRPVTEENNQYSSYAEVIWEAEEI